MRSHRKAGHMTASDQCSSRKKLLQVGGHPHMRRTQPILSRLFSPALLRLFPRNIMAPCPLSTGGGSLRNCPNHVSIARVHSAVNSASFHMTHLLKLKDLQTHGFKSVARFPACRTTGDVDRKSNLGRAILHHAEACIIPIEDRANGSRHGRGLSGGSLAGPLAGRTFVPHC